MKTFAEIISESKVKMVWRSQRSTGTAQIAQLAAWMKLKLAPEYRTLLPEGNPGTNRRWLQCDGHTTGPLEGGCRCWQTSSHTTSAVVWFEKTREIDEKFYPPYLTQEVWSKLWEDQDLNIQIIWGSSPILNRYSIIQITT